MYMILYMAQAHKYTHMALYIWYSSLQGAERLSKVILDMPLMTDFGGIPIKALRDNSMRDLDRSDKGLGIPEAMVLSGAFGAVSLPNGHTLLLEPGPVVSNCYVPDGLTLQRP